MSAIEIEIEQAFANAVWDALKADTNDLRKQQRILKAFRQVLLASREEARQLSAERERLRDLVGRARETLMHHEALYRAKNTDGDSAHATVLSLLARDMAQALPTFDQRDYGDEMPERPRPRRDGPGLDVKALARNPHADLPADSRS